MWGRVGPVYSPSWLHAWSWLLFAAVGSWYGVTLFGGSGAPFRRPGCLSAAAVVRSQALGNFFTRFVHPLNQHGRANRAGYVQRWTAHAGLKTQERSLTRMSS